jgi:hypothetical protein
MELVKRSEFAKICKVTCASITYAIMSKRIPTVGKGYSARIDLSDEAVLSYIKHRENERKKAERRKELLCGYSDDAQLDVSKDLARYVRTVESIRQTRIKTGKEEGSLIDRDMVKRVFAQLYTVDTNQWKTLAANLAAKLAAAYGRNDDGSTRTAERIVDVEVHSILERVKRGAGEVINLALEAQKTAERKICAMQEVAEIRKTAKQRAAEREAAELEAAEARKAAELEAEKAKVEARKARKALAVRNRKLRIEGQEIMLGGKEAMV